MKDITGEIRIEKYEIPSLKSEPARYSFKVMVNVYPKSTLQTLQDHKKMVMVVDGNLEHCGLMSYHIGNEEYWVGARMTKKPKNINVYRYG